jgi:hypothetical protein
VEPELSFARHRLGLAIADVRGDIVTRPMWFDADDTISQAVLWFAAVVAVPVWLWAGAATCRQCLCIVPLSKEPRHAAVRLERLTGEGLVPQTV